jgi:hypothetical protein
MAIPILNHLNFNSKSELQNAILHTTTSGSASDVEGKILYDTGSNTVKYYNGSSWISLTAATSVTVSDNSGSTAMPVVFHDESNNLHDDTGAFTYKPSTGEVVATTFTGALTGNVTGNASGTALTVTQAAQTAITSLGTLTALTVDDVAIDGKVITMTGSSGDTATLTAGTNGTLAITTTDAAAAAANITITADGTFEAIGSTVTLDSGGAINLEPAAGSAILLDGTISVDAGVVTGATSITSTAFVGALTGNADTATLATNSTHVLVTDNESTDEENAIAFVEGATKDASGQVGLESDGTLTYNPSTGTVTASIFKGALTIGGHAVDDIDVGSEFVDADDHLMSSGAIKEKIEGYSYITASSSDTLTNKTIAASQVTEISNITAGEGAQIENIGSTTISATQWGYLGAASGAITNTDVDVNIANLTARLPQITESVTIGDATDVVVTTSGNLVVTGDLTVSGDTITANVGTLTVEDKNIVLNYASGSDTSSTANGSGITIQDAVDASNDATILWDATNDEFDFSHAINVTGTIEASGAITGNLTGNVTGNLILDGNTISGIDDSGEFTDDDNHIMTSAGVQDKILGYGYTTDANVTHRTITAGGNTLAGSETLAFTAGSNVTITESAGAVTITSTDTTTNTQLATAAALIDVSAMDGNNVASFTHSLASQNLIVQMYDTTSGLVVHADVDHTSTNAIAITFANTGAELVTAGFGDIRVVVIDAVNGVTDKTVSYS